MTIEIVFDEITETYYIKVNGDTILECLGKDEVKEMTLAEIIMTYEEALKMLAGR